MSGRGPEEEWTPPSIDVPKVDPVADSPIPLPGDQDETRTRGEVSRQAFSGVVWLTTQKWVVRILSLVTIAVLTRFLSPEEFGLVAAASTVLPFFYLLADLGFAAYIVQAEKVDQRLLSTGFWFSILASVVLAGTLILISPLLGIVFHDDRVVPILQVLSSWVIFTAIASVPTALLRRSMKFSTIAKQGAAAAVIAQVVAIAMTLLGYGVWALVAQSLTSIAVASVWAWIAVRWHPSFSFSFANFVTMARFGTQVLAVEFVAMLRAWAETAIISATLGISAVGYLSIAQRLVSTVQELTGSALVPVTTVAFAKVRSDPGRLRAAYLRALRMTYAVMSPPLTVVAVAAPLIIPILFGHGWENSFQATQVLAVAATLTVGAALDNGLFYGVGRPGRWFLYAIVVDAVTVGTTAFAAQWGLVAITIGFLIVALLSTMARWVLVGGLMQAKARTVAGPFGFLAVAVLTSGLAGWAVALVSAPLPAIVSVILVGVAVLAVHFVVVRLMAKPVLDEGWSIIRDSRRGRRIAARLGRRGKDTG